MKACNTMDADAKYWRIGKDGEMVRENYRH